MVVFEAPLLVPLIFLFLVLCVGFAMGAIFTEIRHLDGTKAGDHNFKEARWLMLIIPSLIGIFLILWWPTTIVGAG